LISIIEEEAGDRESLARLVRAMGYKANEYESAEDYLAWGGWDDGGCLIVDVDLPGMSGLELQQFLGESGQERPMVVTSASASNNEERWAMTRGAVAFLRKPWNDESLSNALRNSLARGADRRDSCPERRRSQPCPFCRESVRAPRAPKGRWAGAEAVCAFIVGIVKAVNSKWAEADGLCDRCWQFYVGVGRVLHFLRRGDAATGGGGGEIPPLHEARWSD
jgi:CheY-like chemotaxis protein